MSVYKKFLLNNMNMCSDLTNLVEDYVFYTEIESAQRSNKRKLNKSINNSWRTESETSFYIPPRLPNGEWQKLAIHWAQRVENVSNQMIHCCSCGNYIMGSTIEQTAIINGRTACSC
jgi:hypothetical protein